MAANTNANAQETVFISYTHGDKEIVHRVATVLKENGNEVWIDIDRIKEGDLLTKMIEDGILKASVVVCFISKKYAQSANCRLEFFYAHTIKKKCLYVVLEKVKNDEVTGMTIYLYGESTRFDAHKVFTQDQNEYARRIYERLMNAFKRDNQSENAVLKEDENLYSARDDCFIGREQIFPAIDKSTKITALYGLPGVGKTSLAKEYSFRRKERAVFDEVFWFNADAEHKINEALYSYGTKLPGYKKADGRMETIERFRNHAENKERILLIFDNIDDMRHVTKSVGVNSVKGKVLLTTRNKRTIPDYAERIDVLPFGEIEMKEYLKNNLKDLDEQQIKNLVKQLQIKEQCLPYKLSMISTILINEPATDVDELLESNYNKSNTFLRRLLVKIKPEVVNLLKYLVVLDPDGIPGKLIGRLVSEDSKNEAMQALLNQNLCVIVAPNTKQYGLKMHRLLQEDLQEYFHLDGEQYGKTIINLVKVLDELFPNVSQHPDKSWSEAALYYSHAIRIIDKGQIQINSPFLYKIAVYTGFALTNYEKAIEYFEQAMGEIREDEWELKANIFNTAGVFYSNLGETAKARYFYKQALDMRQQLFNEDHQDIAGSLNNVGTEYSAIGDTAKALECYEKALDMYQRLFTGDHPYIATSLNNIGNEHSKLGETAKALDFKKKAFEMRQRVFNEDHPDLAGSLNNIGTEHSALGDTAKALECYEKALDMYQRLFKGDHPDIAASLNNIGAENSQLCATTKALDFYQRALEMNQRLFKGDHPYVAGSLNSIGNEYSALGKTAKALDLNKKALEMYERLFKGDHPSIAISLNNLGNTYSKLGERATAKEYFERSLRMFKCFYNDEHPHVKIVTKSLIPFNDQK